MIIIANVYGNAIDLANAQKTLGSDGYTFIDTSKGGKYTPGAGDLVVGGSGAVGGIADSGQALRLAGIDRDATAAAIQGYASSLAPREDPSLAIQEKMDELKQSQINGAVQSFGAARDKSLSNLSREKAAIAPEFYGRRNAASNQSLQNKKNFAEFMAGRGSITSGTNAQTEFSREGQLQGQIGALHRDEAGANLENSRRVTDTQNAYESDVANARAGAETNYLQNMINQMNQDRSFKQASDQFAKQFGLSEAGVTGFYNGNPTFASNQAAIGNEMNEAQLTGNYKGAPILSATQWQKQFEEEQASREVQEQLALQELALSRQKASSSGSGSSATNLSLQKYLDEQSLQKANDEAFNELQKLAGDGKSRSEILNHIKNNWGNIANGGADPNVIYAMADKMFRWDTDASGGWYDLDAKKEEY